MNRYRHRHRPRKYPSSPPCHREGSVGGAAAVANGPTELPRRRMPAIDRQWNHRRILGSARNDRAEARSTGVALPGTTRLRDV
jgi:hypothetical protein